MKYRLIQINLICLFFVGTLAAHAEDFSTKLSNGKQFYIGVQVGYGLGVWNTLPYSSGLHKRGGAPVEGTTEPGLEWEKYIYGSFGKGFNFSIRPGIMFTDYIGFELGISYFLGSKVKQADYSIYYPEYKSNILIKTKMQQMQLNPSLIFNFPNKDHRFTPYAKLGFVLGLASKMTMEDNGTLSSLYHLGKTFYYTKTKDFGGVSIGFNSSVGVNCKLTKNISVYAEIEFLLMSYQAKKGELLKKTQNGFDIIAPSEIREWEYMKKYDEKTETLDKYVGIKAPMNSINFNIGAKYRF